MRETVAGKLNLARIEPYAAAAQVLDLPRNRELLLAVGGRSASIAYLPVVSVQMFVFFTISDERAKHKHAFEYI